MQTCANGARTGEFKDIHRLAQALHRGRTTGADLHEALAQMQCRGGDQGAARIGQLFHAGSKVRGLPHGGVLHVQVAANGQYHDFTRVDADADA